MNRVILHSILISLIIGFALPVRADTTDNFQVYLRGEIKLRESDTRPGAPYKFLVLTPSHFNDTIFVNYNHCSPVVSGRKIVIWYGEDIIFSRTYPDTQNDAMMAVPVKDISFPYGMLKNNTGSMVMFYYDKQLPADGVVLANMLIDKSGIPKPAAQEKYVPKEPEDASTMEWVLAGLMIIFLAVFIFRKLTKPVQQTKRRR